MATMVDSNGKPQRFVMATAGAVGLWQGKLPPSKKSRNAHCWPNPPKFWQWLTTAADKAEGGGQNHWRWLTTVADDNGGEGGQSGWAMGDVEGNSWTQMRLVAVVDGSEQQQRMTAVEDSGGGKVSCCGVPICGMWGEKKCWFLSPRQWNILIPTIKFGL